MFVWVRSVSGLRAAMKPSEGGELAHYTCSLDPQFTVFYIDKTYNRVYAIVLEATQEVKHKITQNEEERQQNGYN